MLDHPLHRLLTFRVLAWTVFVLAGTLVGIGVIPLADAGEVWSRVWPVLAFLLLIKLVSDILDDAGVFTLLAALMARFSGGRTWLLFVLYCLMCIVATAILSLDATVVLMTPIAIGLSRRIGISAIPLLFATVWLANVASLFLPVSNLTNLIAQQRFGWTALEFARAALPVQLALLVVLGLFMAVLFRNQLRENYTRFPRHIFSRFDTRPIILVLVSAFAIAAFAWAVVNGVEPWLATGVLALITLAIRAASGRRLHVNAAGQLVSRFRSPVALIKAMPWDMALFALGLFVLIEPLSQHIAASLGPVLESAGSSSASYALMGGVGALGANLVNNLPAYLAFEASAVTDTHVLMLLVGVNAGPLVTPWASLANLLWIRMAHERGVKITVRAFVVWGLVLVPLLLAGAVAVTTLS